MKLKPLEDRVVIKEKEVEEKNVGGIIIPDTAKEKPQIGEVIAVGTDEELQKNISVGDNILYAKYGGTEVEIENEKYIVVQSSDILAIVE